MLRDILQKALDDLRRDEISRILRKWVDLDEGTPVTTLPLSPEEKAWLKDHPEITIAFDGDYAPYSFQNDKGEFIGIAVDVARELARRAGIQLKIYPEGVWDRLYAAAQKREVDVIATLVLRPERREWFAFTRPYLSIAQYILTRKDNDDIRSREQLAGKTVALVKGYATTSQVLEEFPTVKPFEVDTLKAALEAVSTGKADAAVVGMGMAHHIISQEGFLNLKFACLYGQGFSDERFGVRKDWPELAAILDKALDSLSEQERLKIFQRWSLPEIAPRGGGRTACRPPPTDRGGAGLAQGAPEGLHRRHERLASHEFCGRNRQAPGDRRGLDSGPQPSVRRHFDHRNPPVSGKLGPRKER